MKKILIFIFALSMLVQLNANSTIDQCLNKQNCKFIVFGSVSDDPKMTFVVLKSAWIKFSDKDKNDLRNILKQKIIDAKRNPDKYNDLYPSAPIYNVANQNIMKISSYSVVLSGKKKNGALLMDNEILKNF